MRSRDGSFTFLLSIPIKLLLIIIYSLALNASEYLISYRYLVKNFVLFNETLQISKSMQKCNGEPYSSIIFPRSDDKNLKKIIDINREDFIDYIHKIGLNLTNEDEISNYKYSSITILTLKTTCFKVDFNDSFVKISPLK